jgi:replicative DNA helicase
MLGGFQDSELIIVAARPSVGKTAFGLNVARHAIVNNIPVFMVSLEMSKHELSARLLCDHGQIDSYRYRKARLTDAEALAVSQAANELRDKQLHIDDQANQTMLRIAANARRLKHRHGIRLVIVDYLQLIEPEDRRVPRHEQVAAVSRRLKQLARELKLPIVVMAQLNRVSDESEEPRLADLRESGAIEQDADVVLMLYKPQKDNPRMVAVKIAKNRNGPRDTVPLTFAAEYMRFENYDSLPRVP